MRTNEILRPQWIKDSPQYLRDKNIHPLSIRDSPQYIRDNPQVIRDLVRTDDNHKSPVNKGLS